MSRARNVGLSWFTLALAVLFPLATAVGATSYGDDGRRRLGPDLYLENFVFGQPDPKAAELVERRVVRVSQNPTFGWRADLDTSRKTVEFKEELILPAASSSWKVGPSTKISADRTTATTTRQVPADQVYQYWSHTRGDPYGSYIVRVWIEGELVEEVHFTVRP